MIKRILNFFTLPAYADPEKNRQARLLGYILRGLILLVIGLITAISLTEPEPFSPLNLMLDLMLLGLIPIALVLMAMLKRGFVQMASAILVISLWLGLTYLAWKADGVRDAAFIAQLAVLIVCGLLLGWRSMLTLTILDIAITWIITVLQVNGILLPTFQAPLGYARDFTVVIILSSLVIYFQVKSMQDIAGEQKLSEQRFRDAFENAPIGMALVSLEDQFLQVNRALCDILGYSAEELLSRTVSSITYPEDRAAEAENKTEMVKENARSFSMNKRYIHAMGHLVRGKLSVSLVVDEFRRPLYYLGQMEDITQQVEAGEALRNSEAQTRALLEAVPDIIFKISGEGIYLDFIPSQELMPFLAPEQFIGRHIKDVLPATVASQAMFAVERALETGQLHAFEYEIPFGDELHTYEVRVVKSGPDSVIAIVRDITSIKWVAAEREKLISELESKNAETETLRESAAAVALSLDLNETVSLILDQLQRVVPYDSASIQLLVEENILETVGGRGYPEGVDAIGNRYALNEDDPTYSMVHDGLPYVLYPDVQSVNNRFRGAFYNHIHSWMAIPLHARGRLIGMLTIDGFTPDKFNKNHARLASTFANQAAIMLENARLYTELQSELEKQIALRTAATAISSSLQLSEVLSEICKQMAFTIDASSAYMAIYDQAYSAYTVVAEYIGPNANELERASDLNATYYKKDGAWVFDRSSEGHFAIIHSDEAGLTPWVRNNLASYGGKSVLYIPLHIQGRLIGHAELWESRKKRIFTSEEISFCRAISQQAAIAIANANLFAQLQKELAERQSLIAELESKNEELERFTYTVSHDLKSPLITIRGFLGFIEQDTQSGNLNRLKTDIQRISDATSKMQLLLNELLELSRVGRLRREPQVVPFEELAREAVELVQGRIMERGIKVHIDANMSTVFGDRPRLLEILQNLVDNAAKFMGDQPEPRIAIGEQGLENERPVFYVRDNGMGILPEHHDRIFGLFNKLDPVTEGTGVGLALIKRIVEVHGGRIWVESEVGKGTTFYFSLPGGGSQNDGH